jgi:hypothetical protein
VERKTDPNNNYTFLKYYITSYIIYIDYMERKIDTDNLYKLHIYNKCVNLRLFLYYGSSNKCKYHLDIQCLHQRMKKVSSL